ncbi:MAG: FkbM family methyltransferase [Bryobacteraceae bacterium]|jgi:FkbM family methyltransferase
MEPSLSADIEILWRGMWIVRVGPHYFPYPETLNAAQPPWPRLAGLAEKYLRDANDYWFHIYKPKPGDTIVDIGAGRGEDTFAFSSSVGMQGRVWAIEPHPDSFAALQCFCSLNRLLNVSPLNYACVDRAANLQIETLPVWESNYVFSGNPTESSYPVQGVTFDELCVKYSIGRIDFLKMNIEGAERLALPGCKSALSRTRYACIAAHDFRADRGEGEQFRTMDFVVEFLKNAGFSVAIRDSDPRYYVPYHVHAFR